MAHSHLVVKYALKAMERIAPLRLAEKWDNVGLSILNLTRGSDTSACNR